MSLSSKDELSDSGVTSGEVTTPPTPSSTTQTTTPVTTPSPAGSQEGVTSGADQPPSDATDAWWSVGEYLDGRQVTHQSAKFSLTGNRVFGRQKEEVWDLTDSLAELYEVSQKLEAASTLHLASSRSKKQQQQKQVDIADWLNKDPSHGFIRVWSNDATSQLVPCSLSTSAHNICLVLDIPLNSLHMQLNGDIIRRLDPYEHPLVLQNEYLTGLGYSDIRRIQTEGTHEELSYLIKFHSGKPVNDSTFSRNQLQAFVDVKKGKVMSQWAKKLCVLSGTRLLVYKDKSKKAESATVFQLAKGAVEEVEVKGHEHVLKVTSTLHGEKTILMAFSDAQTFSKWYRKFKKATDKLPTTADLSNCHLEFLPETIFINEQLAMLNLRHNVLRERPLEEDVYTMGWLDDLPRFTHLRSLNLADNNLVTFPLSLCSIKTLVELNLASNKLEEIPPDIAELTNLQALHIHNNHLWDLPPALAALRRLFILVLAFNRFPAVPMVVAHMTDVRVSEVENIIMAGNQISELPQDLLAKMKYVKKVDFRMNKLTLPQVEVSRLILLEHLTHLDIRDNNISDLDLRAVRTLEYLNVERNHLTALFINGAQLKTLFAAHNEIDRFVVSPKPEWLTQIDISHNCLRRLPEWLSDCFFLQKLNCSHNLLTELPTRLLVDGKKLRLLRAGHNHLVSLPGEVDTLALEELHIEHNLLSRLPNTLLARANKLRVLNATMNRLAMLPGLHENTDLNKVQELYLTSNALGDSCMEVIAGYRRLKVLHIADNEIHNLYDADMKKLEFLQELNISTNQLRALPGALGHLNKLVILRAHSNVLQSLPDFKRAKSLRVLDVGHNQLLNVSVTNLMASQINLLDMSLNTDLKVDPREFRTIKHKKAICLVDLTGQNRLLPGLVQRRQHRTSSRQRTSQHRSSGGPQETDYETDPSAAWKVGFSETAGMRNKLCIATLKILKFRNENEALFGMFDGGHNDEVPKILLDSVPQILQEELSHSSTQDQYIKYAMLTAHRKLKSVGQHKGGSALLCHICRRHRDSSANVNGSSGSNIKEYRLNLANVGDIEMVLCRRGEAVLLTRNFTTWEQPDECERVYRSDGIITEDSKVNGTTVNTRLLGVTYLYPHVTPDPYSTELSVGEDDEFIIIGNRGLWGFVQYDEAVEEIYEIGNPVVAAKKLQDLAQGYGSKENIGVLVVRFNTDQGPSLARLRQHKSMSIDDVEAAAQYEAERRKRLAAQKLKLEASSQPPSGSAPAPVKTRMFRSEQRRPQMEQIVEHKDSVEGLTSGEESMDVDSSPGPGRAVSSAVDSSSPAVDSSSASGVEGAASPDAFVSQEINIEGSPALRAKRSPRSPMKTPHQGATSREISPDLKSPLPDLRPLPKQRFRKKNVATEWEGILQKRLTEDVKSKELKQLSRSVSDDSIFDSASLQPVEISLDSPSDSQNIETRKRGGGSGEAANTWRKRMIQPPWYNQVENVTNATYSNNNNNIVKVTREDSLKQDKRPKVRKTIDMFENLGREEIVPGERRKTLVLLERDERSPLSDHDRSSGSLSDPKVEIQTVGGGSSGTVSSSEAPPTVGSLEAGLHHTHKLTTRSPGVTASAGNVRESGVTDGDDDAEVTIVEIARL